MEFVNKTVFVSGANRGIGKALVEAFLKRGVKKIYASARNTSQLPDFKSDLVTPVTLDITNSNQVEEAARIASDVDVLINNAGTAQYMSAFEGSMELIQKDMNTNYYGTLNMMRAFIPILQKTNGAMIANVASIASFVNFPFLGGYSASKAALFSLTQAARIELSRKNISVHSINPGPIDTDMAANVDMEKMSATDAAESILDSLEKEVADIFPDPTGQEMFNVWSDDYRKLEHMVADMANAS